MSNFAITIEKNKPRSDSTFGAPMAFIFIIIARKFRFYGKGRAGNFPVIGPVMAVLFSITGPMCDMLGQL